MDVKLPDGRILRGVPEGTTKEQIAQKMGIGSQTSPAQQFEQENPLLRTAGRFGRNLAGGVASMGDVALTVPRAGAEIVNNAMVMAGAGENPIAQTMRGYASSPTLREQTLGVIDRATGDRLKPAGMADKVVDFANELAVPMFGLGKTPQSPTAIDAVRGVFNPSEPVTQAAKNIYKTPDITQKAGKITAEQLRKSAGQAYRQADESGAKLNKEFTNQFLDEIEKLKPQTTAGKILAGDSPFSKIITRLSGAADEAGQKVGGLRDKALSLQEAQEMDEYLTTVMDQPAFTNAVGKLTKEGRKLYDIQSTLRNMISSSTPDQVVNPEGFAALEKGRGLWSRSMKLSDIENIIDRSEMIDNPATALKTGFRNLYLNKNRLKGYSPEEQKLIKKAAQTPLWADALKTFGSRLVPIGNAVTGNPVAAAATYGGSALAREGATAAQLNRAQTIADLIRGTGNVLPAGVSDKQQMTARLLADILARQQ